ncbi:hypothetical protein [Microbacterium sp. BH-3-3-3]|uniref:hypothetical protein n=1 Tax=Microbacterium sp. BH-3-3-3 TaxID=1906742 RepID=UPI0011A53F90|nr:hypothetical protein [Microbacterium sp. BH-3-3-3]
MGSDEPPPGHPRHVLAFVAGVVALSTAVWAPAGLLGALVMLVVGVAALMFAWEAGTRPGPLRWAGIAGALLAGLVTVSSGFLFLVALARTFS